MTKLADDHFRARLAHELALLYTAHLDAARPLIEAARAAGDAARADLLGEIALDLAVPAVVEEFERRMRAGWEPSPPH